MRRHAASNPIVIGYSADCLFSINVRLGQLLKVHEVEPGGMDLEPLGVTYLDQILDMASEETPDADTLDFEDE